MTKWLRAHEREALLAIAVSAMPAGRRAPAPDRATIDRFEAYLAVGPAEHRAALRALLLGLEAACFSTTFRRLAALPPARALALLERWSAHEPTRLALEGILVPLRLAHHARAEVQAALGVRHPAAPPASAEQPRWRARIENAGKLEADLAVEADAVVVGTGAGGAPVAAELAARGHAVVMLEAGAYHDRTALGGAPLSMLERLYRDAGLTGAVGSSFIPIPVGKAVGGTTLVNSGTCFRPPDRVLEGWAARGLTGLCPEALEPYVDRVMRDLAVGPSSREALGPVAAAIARGADTLGWSSHALDRNAPGCDGRGLCCFGCSAGAKRSTDVAYLPRALSHGAQLYTGVEVERVLVEGDRAVGVVGRAKDTLGRTRTVTVRAKVVVLACGALHTPALLLRQGLCTASGQLGENLSIHPATAALGRMDADVAAFGSVPQGWCVDEFASEGILFEGASAPLEVLAASLPGVGPRYASLVDDAARMLPFGLMIRDTSRGRVRAGPEGRPWVRYALLDADRDKLVRGIALVARLLFAAGAREVITPIAGLSRLRSVDEVETLARARPAASRLVLSAYHPLGTAAMGLDPFRSVVGPEHETHDVLNLYVTDGSALPGPPGVNPMITILSLSLRAADVIARRLDALDRRGHGRLPLSSVTKNVPAMDSPAR